jgi:hypothetical protein
MRAAIVLLAVAGACKRGPPAQRPPPSRYCDQDLTGVWTNSSDPSYAYRLTDHGDVVRGKFFHRQQDGGEAAAVAGDEPLLIELHRTHEALAGVMKTRAASPSGRNCPIEFGIRVSSCQPQAVQVVAETQAGVRDDCTRAREADGGEAPPVLMEFRWDRGP